MIFDFFMTGFFGTLIGYFVFLMLGFIPAMFIFGSNATAYQVFLLTPLIGFGMSTIFVFIGAIICLLSR